MIPSTFKGTGYNKSYKYQCLKNDKNKYLYQVTSVWSGDVFYNVFSGKTYPNNCEAIFAFDEAERQYNQLR